MREQPRRTNGSRSDRESPDQKGTTARYMLRLFGRFHDLLLLEFGEQEGTTDAPERGDAFPRGRARQGPGRLGEERFAGGHRYRSYVIRDRADLPCHEA